MVAPVAVTTTEQDVIRYTRQGTEITEQRRGQAATRGELPEAEQDPVFGLYKYNPLAAWTEDDIWHAIRALDIPYNPLHDQEYPSIGFEPCTRAIQIGRASCMERVCYY